MKYIRIYLLLFVVFNTITSVAQQRYNCRLLEKVSESISREKEKIEQIALFPDLLKIINIETGDEFFKSTIGRPQQEIDSLVITLDSLNTSLDSAVIFGELITIVDTLNFFDSSCNIQKSKTSIRIVNSKQELSETDKQVIWYLYSVGTHNNNLVLTFSFKDIKEYTNFEFALKINEITLQDVGTYTPLQLRRCR